MVFLGIEEEGKDEDVRKTLRDFYINNLKISDCEVDKIEYQRVHRVPSKSKPRPIKARYLRYTDKALIQVNAKNLKGSKMFVAEDYPKRVRDLRQKQLGALRAARNAGKIAYFSKAEPTKLFVDRVWLPIKDQDRFVAGLGSHAQSRSQSQSRME